MREILIDNVPDSMIYNQAQGRKLLHLAIEWLTG
jgi:hypothetical protein